MRMARLGAAGGGDVMSERPRSPASIRVRCALRSREGADAGADDAGAKGPPCRGGHNAYGGNAERRRSLHKRGRDTDLREPEVPTSA